MIASPKIGFSSAGTMRKKLGETIEKYEAEEIYMESLVDLERIFSVSVKSRDSSSAVWDKTLDYIRD